MQRPPDPQPVSGRRAKVSGIVCSFGSGESLLVGNRNGPVDAPSRSGVGKVRCMMLLEFQMAMQLPDNRNSWLRRGESLWWFVCLDWRAFGSAVFSVAHLFSCVERLGSTRGHSFALNYSISPFRCQAVKENVHTLICSFALIFKMQSLGSLSWTYHQHDQSQTVFEVSALICCLAAVKFQQRIKQEWKAEGLKGKRR